LSWCSRYQLQFNRYQLRQAFKNLSTADGVTIAMAGKVDSYAERPCSVGRASQLRKQRTTFRSRRSPWRRG
jgi:hypothetical protein